VVTEEVHAHAGLERSAVELTEGLAHRGHRLSLIYQRGGNLLDRYERVTERQIRPHGPLTIDPDRRAVSAIQMLAGRASITGRVRPGPVYLHSISHALFGRLVAGPRRAVVCHLRVPPATPLTDRGKRAMVRAVTKFVAVSEATRAAHIEAGIPEDRIETVATGVDLDRYRADERAGAELRHRLGVDDRAPIVAYAGRLDPVKGIERLLAAHRLLPAETALVIAGRARLHTSAAEGARYEAHLRGLALPDRVHWLGHVDDVRPLLSAADVMVLPSVWEEPAGRALLETMACERPVIATRVGGTPEYLRGWEPHIVEPNDPLELATAIERVLLWRLHSPGLGAACRQHIAENFSLDRMVDGIEAVIRAANANHRGPRRSVPDGRALPHDGGQ
jgi:glycosyltransferase involved in cell wall biosynthesis